MESYEKFYKATYIWNRKMLAFVGHDIYDKDFKINIRTLLMYALTATLFIFIIYTMCVYDNFVRFNNILYLSCAIQGAFKMYNVRYSSDFLQMITQIEQLFKLHNKTESKERQLLFQRFSFYSDLIVKCACVMYMGSVLLSFPYCIYMYVFKQERVPLILVYVPGIDETTLGGFCITVLIQLVATSAASVGLCSCDSFYALLLSNTPIMPRLIEDEVNQLNRTLEETPNDVRTWKYQFRNILIMHREFSIYLSDLDGIFFKICFVQVATCMIIAVSLLYIAMTTSYIPAFIFAPCALVSLFMFCTFGHIVEEANGIAEDAILSIKWDLLGEKEKKMYNHLLLNVQNPCYLTIGGLTPLNWPTCVQLFKSIYYWLGILHSMA